MRHDAALPRNARDVLQRQTATIITQSAVLFKGMMFYVADYHDEDVTISDTTVGEPDEPELLEVDDEEARIQVFTAVAFVASVAANDPNIGYYDREEGTHPHHGPHPTTRGRRCRSHYHRAHQEPSRTTRRTQ